MAYNPKSNNWVRRPKLFPRVPEERLWDASEAPTVQIMRISLEESGVDRWDQSRVLRLCALLRITTAECFGMAGVFGSSRIRKLMRKKKCLPMEIALHLSKIETFFVNETIRSEGGQAQLSDHERIVGEMMARGAMKGIQP